MLRLGGQKVESGSIDGRMPQYICQLDYILGDFIKSGSKQVPKVMWKYLRACLKYFDKREGKADNKGKQVGDEGECVNIQAISGGKSMKRYERI